MSNDLIGIIIVTIFAGMLLIFAGCLVKFFKTIDLVLSFDENKHDKGKVVKVFGNTILIVGILVFTCGILSIFLLKNLLKYTMLMQISILILGVLWMVYRLNTYCKR